MERRAVHVFDRILVGVDGTAASLAAAAQADRLVVPGGTVELVRALYLIDAHLQGWPRDRVDETLEREGLPSLAVAAARLTGEHRLRTVDEPPREGLLSEAARLRATLIALGTHERGRLRELATGGTCGAVLRAARCSVLVARPSADDAAFPRSVVVGVDGSLASLRAFAAARSVAERHGLPLRAVLARGGSFDLVQARRKVPGLEILDGPAVDELVAASRASDLVVVGSRGLHGLRALGSVSERVAHAAASSVLVVRRPGVA